NRTAGSRLHRLRPAPPRRRSPAPRHRPRPPLRAHRRSLRRARQGRRRGQGRAGNGEGVVDRDRLDRGGLPIMWKDFKEFAIRGNVIDLAIGILIGGAFAPNAEKAVGGAAYTSPPPP